MKQILVFILLIIFVIGITHTAYAQNAISGTVVSRDFNPNGNLNSQATCASLVDGIWNEDTKTCTIPDNGRTLKIGYKQTLIIDSGYTLAIANSGDSSVGIYMTVSGTGSISGQIINNGIIIISNSGAYSHGIQISKPSSITNNGIILISNSGRGSNGIFTADYVGCSYAIQAYTGGCATSLTNNGDIIISNTNPPSSSKWDQSNGIYGGKIIDNGTIRVMDKAEAYRELAEKKALNDQINVETKQQAENTTPQTENTIPQITCGQGTELVGNVCQSIKDTNNEVTIQKSSDSKVQNTEVFDKPVEELEQPSISNDDNIFLQLIEMFKSLFNFS